MMPTQHLNPRAAARRRWQAGQAQTAEQITERNAARVHRIDAGVDILIAVAVALGLAWALAVWATPCADAALCLAPMVPLRTNWLATLLLRLRGAYLRRLIASAEEDLAFQDENEALVLWELQQIPLQRSVTRAHLGALRRQLGAIQLATGSR